MAFDVDQDEDVARVLGHAMTLVEHYEGGLPDGPVLQRKLVDLVTAVWRYREGGGPDPREQEWWSGKSHG